MFATRRSGSSELLSLGECTSLRFAEAVVVVWHDVSVPHPRVFVRFIPLCAFILAAVACAGGLCDAAVTRPQCTGPLSPMAALPPGGPARGAAAIGAAGAGSEAAVDAPASVLLPDRWSAKPRRGRRSKVQVHVARVCDVGDVNDAIRELFSLHPWSSANQRPYAFRYVKRLGPGDGGDSKTGGEHDDDEDEEEEEEIVEGCDDGRDVGSGEKLLGQLQRWDGENVLLMCSRWDDGVPSVVDPGRHKMMLECTRDALQQCHQGLAAANAPEMYMYLRPPAGVPALEVPSTALVVADSGTGAGAGAGAGTGAGPADAMSLALALPPIGAAGAAARSSPTRDRARATAPVASKIMDADAVEWPAGHDESQLVMGFNKGTKRTDAAHFRTGMHAAAPAHNPAMRAKVAVRNSGTAGHPGASSDGASVASTSSTHVPREFAGMMAAAVRDHPHLGTPVKGPLVSQRHLDQLRHMRRPPVLVHRVMACVSAVTGWQGNADLVSAVSSRSDATAGMPFHVSWTELREMLASDMLLPACMALRVADLHPSVVDSVVQTLTLPLEAGTRDLSAINKGVKRFHAWLGRVLRRYDEVFAVATNTAPGQLPPLRLEPTPIVKVNTLELPTTAT